jgi:hypothetical protein
LLVVRSATPDEPVRHARDADVDRRHRSPASRPSLPDTMFSAPSWTQRGQARKDREERRGRPESGFEHV